MEGRLHLSARNDQSQFPNTVVGSADPPSHEHTKHVASITGQSVNLSIRGVARPIRLEPLPFGPARMQSGDLQRRLCKRVMGIKRRGRLVLGSVHGPLSMRRILRPRNLRLPGLTEIFPQHCQLLVLTPHQHLRELTDELAAEGSTAGQMTKGRRLLKLLQSHIGDILTPLPVIAPSLPKMSEEQRVNTEQLRVINDSPIVMIPRITDAPAIMHYAGAQPNCQATNQNDPVSSSTTNSKQYSGGGTVDKTYHITTNH